MKIEQRFYDLYFPTQSCAALLCIVSFFIFSLGFAGCSKVGGGAGEDTEKDVSEVVEQANPPVAISVSIDKDPLGINETSMVTAIIKDSAGKPVVQGTQINFSVDPNDLARFTPNPNQFTVDDKGIVLINLKPIKTGIGVIKAETLNGAIGTLPFTIVDPDTAGGGVAAPSGLAQTIILSAVPMPIVADGISQTTITAVVSDPNHHPVANNTLVFFTITSGSGMITPSASTKEGFATAILTSSTTAGPMTLQASSGSASGTLALTYVPGKPAHIVLSPAKNSLLPDGSSQCLVKALITDAYGNKITQPPTTVIFNINLGCSITESAQTDPNGIATAIITAGTMKGTAIMTATAGDAHGQTAVNISDLDVAKINVIAVPDSLYADGQSTSTITAQVMDPNNRPVSDNTPITFTILDGFANSGIIQASALTSGGIAKTTYTSGTAAQTIIIQVASGGMQATVPVSLKAAPPSSLSVEASSDTLQVGESNTISAYIKNTLGQPVNDAIVTFSTSAGDIDPNTPDVQNKASIKSINGIARTTLTSTSTLGAVTITAESSGIYASTSVEFIAGPPETVSVQAVPADLLADGISTSTITVTILDTYGNPVADGSTILFDPNNATYGTISPLVATTNKGIATVLYTSPSFLPASGSDNIPVRTTNGKTAEVIIHLSGPQISSIDLEAAPASVPADGKTQATISATVNLVGGGTAPDGTIVVFSIEGGGSFGGTKTLSTSTGGGVAYATLTSDPNIGTATIQALAGGRTAEIQINYTPGSVNLSIIPNSLLGTGEETATVVALLTTADGKPAPDNEMVVFSLSNGSLGSFTDPNGLDIMANGKAFAFTYKGKAVVIFHAGPKEGELTITATWNPSGIEIYGTTPLSIQPPPSDIQIAEGYPRPDAISIKGTGGISTSLIVFNVIDGHGNYVPDGYRIDFSIESGPNGGETLIPLSGRTQQGQVSTILRSGFKSGPVSIKATYYHNTRVTTTTSWIAISAGPPVGEEFGIAAEYRNISGNFHDFLENTITIGAGDVYGNAIPDNTAISFKTYNTGGSFKKRSALTLDGICSDILVSKDPTPLQGFLSVTAETNDGGRTTHVTSIAVTPYPDNHIIYVGTNGGGVYKSIDGGSSWKNISRSSKADEQGQNWIDPYVNAISVDPDNYNVVYAATGYLGKGNIFRSLDGGLNWNSNDPEEWDGLLSTQEAVIAVLCDGDNSSTDYPYVWIGTEGLGALYACDGKHFEWGGIVDPVAPTLETPPGSGIYTNPTNIGDGTMTEPTLSYTSKTQDWTAHYQITGAIVSRASLNTDVSGSNADGWMSPNPPDVTSAAGTKTWTITYTGGFNPADPQNVLVLSGKGELNIITTSEDTLTERWQVQYKDPDPNTEADEYFDVRGSGSGLHAQYKNLTEEYTTNEVTFYINQTGEFEPGDTFIFYTIQDGWSVESQKTGFPVNIHEDAKTNQEYTSCDLAVHFTIVSGPKRFYKFADKWTFTTTATGKWLVRGTVSGTQYGLAEADSVYESDNGEVKFTIINPSPGDSSFEEGDTFHFHVTESGLGYGQYVREIVKVPGTHADKALLYAATKTGVVKSSSVLTSGANGGKVWENVASFTGNSINTIKLHPLSDGTKDIIYVGTDDAGVWASLDSGQTWTRHSEGMGKGLSASTPVADQANKGNGVMTRVSVDPNVKSEKWTITCKQAIKDGGIFNVSGSLSGAKKEASVGIPYTCADGSISFTIFDGTFDFEVGDTFTFTTQRDPGAHIEDLLLDHVNNKLYAITYFWGSIEPHAVGNVYVHDLNPDGSFTSGAWKEANQGLPQYDPPDDTTLFAHHAMGIDNPKVPASLYIGGEGINLYRADSGLHSGEPAWHDSKSGLTNLIMARMPILFSGECTMDITENIIWERGDGSTMIVFTVYIQDVNGNPPIAASTFRVEHITPSKTIVLADIEYLDCYTYQGTFRNPADPSTDNPYVFYVTVWPLNDVVFTFTPTNTLPAVPGSSGTEIIKSFNY